MDEEMDLVEPPFAEQLIGSSCHRYGNTHNALLNKTINLQTAFCPAKFPARMGQ